MPNRRSLVALSIAFVASLVLASCDEAEQGRVLRYEKGTYLGQKDTPLAEEDRDELRARTRMQQGS